MKILVFGKTGQVGTELQRQGQVTALGEHEGNLTDPEGCAAIVRQTSADVVINAAAYTAVDKAESEEELATVINGHAPTAMAHAAAERGIPFLHISTDYVYTGVGTDAWTPDAATGPLNAYGRSKLAGDTGVAGAGGTYAVLRTSWAFSAHGNNFVKTMLRIGKERDALAIVADQVGGPTSAASIAGALLRIADQLAEDPGRSGIYHFAGSPDVSWADFARAIFDKSGLAATVNDIPTSDYPTPATRPLNSRLDCSGLTKTFGIERPDWRADLEDVLRDLEQL